MVELSSPLSTLVTVTLEPTSWWLKSVTNPDLDTAIRVVGWTMREVHEVDVHNVVRTLDATAEHRPIVLRGPISGHEGSLTLHTWSQAEYEAVDTLVRLKQTLLLQSVIGMQWWVEVVGDVEKTPRRAVPSSGEPYPVRHFFEWVIPLREVDAL